MGAHLLPLLSTSTLAWTGQWRVAGDTDCGVAFGKARVKDLDLVDDAGLLGEFVVSIVEALGPLGRLINLLGLQVAWSKTRIQLFSGILDDTIRLIRVLAREWWSQSLLATSAVSSVALLLACWKSVDALGLLTAT